MHMNLQAEFVVHCNPTSLRNISPKNPVTTGSSAVPPVCGGLADMPVHPVSWRPEVSEASHISGFELSGPPQCSSRVTSNLGGEFPLSF